MPHCIIEYSKDLESSSPPLKLIQAVHHAAIGSGLFETGHIRTRSIAYENFIAGYDVQSFVHVTLRILFGRNLQQKKDLSRRVLGELESMGLSSISLTVEVSEIERETYAKKIINI